MTPTGQSTPRLLGWYASVLSGLVVAFFAVIVFSLANGEQFHPYDFQRRRYLLCRLPVLGIQFSPTIYGAADRSAIVGYLSAHRWLPEASPSDAARRLWVDLRETSWWEERTSPQKYFVDTLFPGSQWVDWSEAHPQRAASLWPVIAQRVSHHDYLHLPELMALAVDSQSDAEWSEQLAAWEAAHQVP